jgi:hypothetical protein
VATYTVKPSGGTFSSMNAAFAALGTTIKAGDEVVIGPTDGTTTTWEPDAVSGSSYTSPTTISDRIFASPVTFRLVTSSENDEEVCRVRLARHWRFRNCRNIIFDTSGSDCTLEWRGSLRLENCRDFTIKGSRHPDNVNRDVTYDASDSSQDWTDQTKSNFIFVNQFRIETLGITTTTERILVEGVAVTAQFGHGSGNNIVENGQTLPGRSHPVLVTLAGSNSGLLARTNNITFRNMHLFNGAHDGFRIQHAEDVLIEDCDINDLWPTTYQPQSQENGRHTDGVQVVSCRRGMIRRCRIRRVGYQGLWLRTDSFPTFTVPTEYVIDDFVISGCTVSEMGLQAINAYAATRTDPKAPTGIPTAAPPVLDGPTQLVPIGAGGLGIGIKNTLGVRVENTVARGPAGGLRVEWQPTSAPAWFTASNRSDPVLGLHVRANVEVVNCVVNAFRVTGGAGRLEWRINDTPQTGLPNLRVSHSAQTTLWGQGSTGPDFPINPAPSTAAPFNNFAVPLSNPGWDESTFLPFDNSALVGAGSNVAHWPIRTTTVPAGTTALQPFDLGRRVWDTPRTVGAWAGPEAELPAPPTPNAVAAGPEFAELVAGTVTVELDGSATTSTGGTLTQQWSTISGPDTVTYSASTSLVTDATFTVVGVYVIRLRATVSSVDSDAFLTVTVTDSAPPITGLLLSMRDGQPMVRVSPAGKVFLRADADPA